MLMMMMMMLPCAHGQLLPSLKSVNLSVPDLKRFTIHHAVTLTFDPLTLNVSDIQRCAGK